MKRAPQLMLSAETTSSGTVAFVRELAKAVIYAVQRTPLDP